MTTTGLELSGKPLERAECLLLLSRADLARVVLSVRALPVALPARISLTGEDHLLLASHEYAVAVAARRRDVISVQIDGLEDDGSTWSVMASGIIATATPGEEFIRPSLQFALDRGATLFAMPLSVIIGQRAR